jgi:hypothetical protein
VKLLVSAAALATTHGTVAAAAAANDNPSPCARPCTQELKRVWRAFKNTKFFRTAFEADSDPARALQCCRQLRLAPALDEDEVIFKQGDYGDCVYIVLEGGVRVQIGGRVAVVLGAVRDMPGLAYTTGHRADLARTHWTPGWRTPTRRAHAGPCSHRMSAP